MKLTISSGGQEIFADLGQPPIAPAVGRVEVPEAVGGWWRRIRVLFLENV